MKAYCNNCVHCVDESFFRYYTSIMFRNDKRAKIKHGMDLCKANVKITETYHDYYDRKHKFKDVIVDSCFELNQNNDCIYFKPYFHSIRKILLKISRIIFKDGSLK